MRKGASKMDPVELAHWTDAVYSVVVCSAPEEDELRRFCELWFKELVHHRGGTVNAVFPDRADRS